MQLDWHLSKFSSAYIILHSTALVPDSLAYIIKLMQLIDHVTVHVLRNIVAQIVKATDLFNDNVIKNNLRLDELSSLKSHFGLDVNICNPDCL